MAKRQNSARQEVKRLKQNLEEAFQISYQGNENSVETAAVAASGDQD